ncbi:hypothetical protein BV25DRAFT_1841941 [Artomyces pyxidatus]|uniref:Uncharacterized protein n=1 Tax=Artomyces pyxidatus TaxID=48021 RepID=A0ACB8SM06_9AGAM|nr:hypothetical protein BV25DRAFT_1841941 [Artomyces pyxidatus]
MALALHNRLLEIPLPEIQRIRPVPRAIWPLIVEAWQSGNGTLWRTVRKPWHYLLSSKDRAYFLQWTASIGAVTDGERDWLLFAHERAFLLNCSDLVVDAQGDELWPAVGFQEFWFAEDEGYESQSESDWDDEEWAPVAEDSDLPLSSMQQEHWQDPVAQSFPPETSRQAASQGWRWAVLLLSVSLGLTEVLVVCRNADTVRVDVQTVAVTDDEVVEDKYQSNDSDYE